MRNGKNSFVYLLTNSDGNSSADMLEKSTSDWIGRGKPARKKMYYHYSAFLDSRLGSFVGLIPKP